MALVAGRAPGAADRAFALDRDSTWRGVPVVYGLPKRVEYSSQARQRPRGCGRCIQCSGLVHFRQSLGGSSGLPDYQLDWWPGGLSSPGIYFQLRARQLEQSCGHTHSSSGRPLWRQGDSGCGPSSLAAARGFPPVTVAVPSSYTNVSSADTRVEPLGVQSLLIPRASARGADPVDPTEAVGVSPRPCAAAKASGAGGGPGRGACAGPAGGPEAGLTHAGELAGARATAAIPAVLLPGAAASPAQPCGSTGTLAAAFLPLAATPGPRLGCRGPGEPAKRSRLGHGPENVSAGPAALHATDPALSSECALKPPRPSPALCPLFQGIPALGRQTADHAALDACLPPHLAASCGTAPSHLAARQAMPAPPPRGRALAQNPLEWHPRGFGSGSCDLRLVRSITPPAEALPSAPSTGSLASLATPAPHTAGQLASWSPPAQGYPWPAASGPASATADGTTPAPAGRLAHCASMPPPALERPACASLTSSAPRSARLVRARTSTAPALERLAAAADSNEYAFGAFGGSLPRSGRRTSPPVAPALGLGRLAPRPAAPRRAMSPADVDEAGAGRFPAAPAPGAFFTHEAPASDAVLRPLFGYEVGLESRHGQDPRLHDLLAWGLLPRCFDPAASIGAVRAGCSAGPRGIFDDGVEGSRPASLESGCSPAFATACFPIPGRVSPAVAVPSFPRGRAARSPDSPVPAEGRLGELRAGLRRGGAAVRSRHEAACLAAAGSADCPAHTLASLGDSSRISQASWEEASWGGGWQNEGGLAREGLWGRSPPSLASSPWEREGRAASLGGAARAGGARAAPLLTANVAAESALEVASRDASVSVASMVSLSSAETAAPSPRPASKACGVCGMQPRAYCAGPPAGDADLGRRPSSAWTSFWACPGQLPWGGGTVH